MSDDQKKQLEQQLWNIANTLRGKMGADEFRDYILGFIFYKYLSERMHLYANEILKEDDIKYENIIENTTEGEEYLEAIREESLLKLGYFLKPSELFSEIAKKGNSNGKAENESTFILQDLTQILNHIEQSTMGTDSEDDFNKLFEDLDLTSSKLGKTESAKNELIAKVLGHLDKIDFKLKDADSDVLGDAYEYLIGQFASGAGKKAGEFYTPQQISTVLARIVTMGKKKIKSVYDPTHGSGSLLLRIKKEVDEVSNFYGQELNRTTYNLARMNMILHGVHYRQFDLKQEDTLEHPQHLGMQFEAVVANPPFSAQWSASPLHMSEDRFSQYGKLAPASKADFAFVQHMIYHLADNGTMAVVLPHGALYRGGSEHHIRKYLIEDRNYLDAVIGLPPNIFYGTTIQTCILVFKKCRENPENILFIDASKHFEKVKNQNFLRLQDIDKIVTTYRDRKIEAKYSYLAPLSEIEENAYNLNIIRYVNSFEPDVEVNLNMACELLKRINVLSLETDKKIISYCSELNIPAPIGNNIALLSQYKKGIMQKIFSHEIRFKNDNGKEFPTWEKKKFGDIYSFLSTNSFSRENLNYENGIVKNIHYGDIHTKFKVQFDITKELVPYINSEILLRITKDNYCREGDLVIADASEDYADVGKTIEIVNLNHEKTVAGLHTILARPDLSILAVGFGGFLMKSGALRNQIMIIAQGTKVLSISSGRLAAIKIELPIKAEQTKIANFLSLLDEKINLCQL